MISFEKAIPEVPCPKCYLLTPGWRKHCIHCGCRHPDRSTEGNRPSNAPPATTPAPAGRT